MLSEYISVIKNSEKYKISQKELMLLQRMALNHLRLNNMNELRDRYEGQAYLNNFLVRSYAEKALGNFLGDNSIDAERQFNDKNYKPIFKYKGYDIELITTTLDQFPLIPRTPFTIGCIVLVNLDSRSAYLTGFFNLKDVVSSILNNPPSPIALKSNLGYLEDFSTLSFNVF